MLSRKFFSVALIGAATLTTAGAHAATLRVCADPDYLPYSNRTGQGFENQIAEAVAKSLGDKLQYTWASYRGHGGFSQFLADTLDAGKCDVVMDIPYGNRDELTTKPYYVSSYVFVFKKDRHYDLANMDAPILRTIKVGYEEGTPPETGLKLRGLLFKSTRFAVGDKEGASPTSVLDAVRDGRVDVAITWEPSIGAFLSRYPDLAVVAVPNERATGSPEQYSFPMSMGVRESDTALQQRLDKVISEHHGELKTILKDHGVKLYVPEDEPARL